MEQKLIRKILQIEGMTCARCEMRIEKALKKLDGVVEVKAVFSSSDIYITYDENVTGRDRIYPVCPLCYYFSLREMLQK